MLGQFFFSDADPIVRRSRKAVVQNSDMPRHPAALDPRAIDPDTYHLPLEGPWRFAASLLYHHRQTLLRSFLCNFLRVGFALLAPVLIHGIVRAISENPKLTAVSGPVWLACGLTASSILGGIVINQTFYWNFAGYQLHQAILSSLVYRQVLALSSRAQSRHRSGEIVNLLSSHVNAIAHLGFIVPDLFYLLLLLLSVTILLYHYLGAAAFMAVSAIGLLGPVVRRVGQHCVRDDGTATQVRDLRLNLISQILLGIRNVKLFNLGPKLEQEVADLRASEMRFLQSRAFTNALSVMLFGGTTTIVCLLAFWMRLLLGQHLDSATVFGSLGLLILLEVPFLQLPDLVNELSGVQVGLERVTAFLGEEQQRSSEARESAPDQPVGFAVSGLCYRPENANSDALQDLHLELVPGESVAVVGPIGAGKSSLIACLLDPALARQGEIRYSSLGQEVRPRLGLVPQEAFIVNGTLRENIVLGESSVDEETLQRAVQCAVLQQDIRALPAGLDTEIGEHGVNLSGGQRQRVSLCRAMVHRPGLVLLDDPMSAVDPATEKALLDRLLFGEWRSITRLVVTHRLDHLDRFDRIVYLKEGRVVLQGPPMEVLTSPGFQEYYSDAVQAHLKQKCALADPSIDLPETEAPECKPADSQAARVTEDETRPSGHVRLATYHAYLRAMGGGEGFMPMVIQFGLLLSVVLVNLAPFLQNIWLAVWTSSGAAGPGNASGRLFAGPWWRAAALVDAHGLLIYGGFGLVTLAFIFLQRWLWYHQAIVASGILHRKAAAGVIHAPVRFFDSTPSGVILGRFSRDITTIEKELRWTFENTVRIALQVIVTLVFMLACVPMLAISLLPVCLLYYQVQRKFRAASRGIKRLAQVNLSPLFSQMRETFEGLESIRASAQGAFFLERFARANALYLETARAQELVDRWFSVRVPVLSGGISVVVSIGVVFAAHSGTLSPGIAGLALTYLITFWTLLNWSVRTFALTEAEMTSVERLCDFASLPGELDGKLTAGEFGAAGAIEFRGVRVRYAPHLPDVLKGLDIAIPAGSHVGIVGRTGSGKSTFLQALVRLVEVTEGEILIDGVDIRAVPLAHLREIVAVIPQSPFLFNGDLRSNLDPFLRYSNKEILEQLEDVSLRGLVESLPDGLETPVHDNGRNFSHGQRQLLCLGRALLRRPRIILLDEATANVDMHTDLIIHERLRQIWTGTTVIIIAHRLATVTDCDQVIELNDGRVVQGTW